MIFNPDKKNHNLFPKQMIQFPGKIIHPKKYLDIFQNEFQNALFPIKKRWLILKNEFIQQVNTYVLQLPTGSSGAKKGPIFFENVTYLKK